MLRRSVPITTAAVSPRLLLACDPDVILAVASNITHQPDPNYEPTEEEEEAIGKAIGLVAQTGELPAGVEVPPGASYIIVRPLTEGEVSKAEGAAPFNAQYGSVVLGQVFKKIGKNANEERLMQALAQLPAAPAAAAQARLDYDDEVRARKAQTGLVEIDGATGAEAWAEVEAIEKDLRRAVIREIAAHVDRLTRGGQGKA